MKAYTKPTLIQHGSVESLTQAGFSGSRLDVTLTAGTPIVDIVITLS